MIVREAVHKIGPPPLLAAAVTVAVFAAASVLLNLDGKRMGAEEAEVAAMSQRRSLRR